MTKDTISMHAGTGLSAMMATAFALCGCGEAPSDASDGLDPVVSEESSVATEPVSPSPEDSVEKAIITCTDPAVCCSREQRATIGNDEDQVSVFLDSIAANRRSLLFLPTTRSDQLLQRNFGTTDFDDLTFVFDTYALINSNLSNTEYVCLPESERCSGGALAINVSPNQNRVLLCPVYFESSALRRAQVLVHEASHQGRNTPDGLGTDDLNTPDIHDSFSYERYAPVCASSAGCF